MGNVPGQSRLRCWARQFPLDDRRISRRSDLADQVPGWPTSALVVLHTAARIRAVWASFIFGSMVVFNYKAVRYCNRLGMRRHLAHRHEAVPVDADLEKAAWFGNAILGALVAYLVTSTFISTLYYPTFWILTGLAVALKNTTERYSKNVSEVVSQPIPARVNPWGAGLARRDNGTFWMSGRYSSADVEWVRSGTGLRVRARPAPVDTTQCDSEMRRV
jgi:hypothetical protein